MQAMPRSVRYVRSSSQITGINGFSAAGTLWLMLIGLLVVIFWKVFSDEAEEHGVQNKTGKWSSWNWFTHYNTMRLGTNLPALMLPPKSPTELPNYIGLSGFGTPVNFNYYESGIYNDTPYYTADTVRFNWVGQPSEKRWLIWWDGENWIISNELGVKPPTQYFINTEGGPMGKYLSVNPPGLHHYVFTY